LDALLEDVHNGGSEHVHAKETEVVTGAQARHQEALLGLSGGGLFDHVLDDVKVLAAGHAPTADGAIVGEQALSRWLHRRYGTRFGLGEGDHLPGTTVPVAAYVEVIADQVQEGLPINEGARAVHGVAMAERAFLRHEGEAAGVIAHGGRVGPLVSGGDDNTDLLDPGAQCLLHDNTEH